MAGIIFLKTKDLETIRDFYTSKIGMKIWLEQSDCIILKHDNMLLGFCEREEIDNKGIITFFYPLKSDVDTMYDKFKDTALDEPKENTEYKIYHFFTRDPEQRTVEFQFFLHSVDFDFYAW